MALRQFNYIKRLRMEVDLRRYPPHAPRLPPEFVLVPWQPQLLERHARAKLASFCDEFDSQVFPCLSGIEGCRRLMQEIAGRDNFVPEATWLVRFLGRDATPPFDCGTIQGLQAPGWMGSVQNIGVVPQFRGLGLGRALLQQALCGFHHLGLMRVCLEVTARNVPAVNLYRSLGFYNMRTSYRTLEAVGV